MFRTWLDLTMLAVESQQVICLRTMKMAAGGRKANKEARLMLTEKAVAGLQESSRLFMGASPQSIVKRYRRKVRANAPPLAIARWLERGDRPRTSALLMRKAAST